MPATGHNQKLYEARVNPPTRGHQALYAAMIDRCWGTKQLAEFLGQTRAAMYPWLFSDKRPSLKVALALKNLGVEYAWFFEPPEKRSKKEKGQAS